MSSIGPLINNDLEKHKHVKTNEIKFPTFRRHHDAIINYLRVQKELKYSKFA